MPSVTDVVSEEDKAKEGKYSQFYAEFGAVLKEGLGEDFANKERIAKLLRFASTTHDGLNTSFADYKARMKEGQDAIYYITADTLAAAKNSPQLEVFKKKGIEVLLMTDRVDEWALNYCTTLTARRCSPWPRVPWTWASCRTKKRRRPPRKPPKPSSRAGQAQGSACRRRARHQPPGRLARLLVVRTAA
jgi:hypothetical protein